MDPDAALITMLEAIENRDRATAYLYFKVIFAWMQKGGYPPNCQAAVETLRDRIASRI